MLRVIQVIGAGMILGLIAQTLNSADGSHTEVETSPLQPQSTPVADSNAPALSKFVNSWGFLIGNWELEGLVGDAPVKGTAHFKWAAGKGCYFGEQTWKVGADGRIIRLAQICGWNAATKESIERGFSSLGETAIIRYQEPTDDSTVIKGTVEGVGGDGQPWSGTVALEQLGPNKFKLSTIVEGQTMHSIDYVWKEDLH